MKVLELMNMGYARSVRVIKIGENAYQAQFKKFGKYENYGPEAETMDHAFYWAFQCVKEMGAFVEGEKP